jgi:hypothetical protein
MIRRLAFAAALCAAATGAIALGIASTAEEKSSQSPTDTIQRLQDRVRQLEARVAALEKKQPMVVPPPTGPVPFAPIKPLPRGWREQRFNGMRYYLVPLAENKNSGASSRQ